MSSETSVERHSTVASFRLLAGDREFAVAQVAPTFLVFDAPTEIPPGPATLLIRVDGEELERAIEVLPVSDIGSTRVPIRRD